MAVLEVKNMEKSFGKTKVLKNVSFSVERGDVISIIGSSGSGKTTLLRCINFLETPDGGTVSVNGKVILDAKAAKKIPEKEKRSNRLRFGFVFQDFNLFPQYTALGNVTLAMKLLSKDGLKKFNGDIDKIAMGYLEQVGLADKANLYPCNLSGGQKQRVAIARALALNPEILFFDEPTSALDPELTVEVLSTLKELAKKNITMIIITHEMSFARDVSKRVLFMDNGVITEDGTPDEIFGNPKHERTREFLKSYIEK